MTTELSFLLWSVVLGVVHVFATGMVTVQQHGMAYGLSSRDEKKELTGIGARVQRAFANYQQTFPFFSAVIVAGHVLNRHGFYTVTGAELYFFSRLAFVFLYAGGVVGVRTLAYLLSMAGIIMVLIGIATP